ncbi:MAG: phage integrase SAM-like domain-containing protein, partial [Muribaculaceae bacterium]|nr:phage integrase SAM-like domain-containing protein [Muribaculaceae bacterium]
MLRIVNNRKKAEIACGFHLEAADLDDALSPSPSRKNVRMAALLAMWQGKIASLKLELAVEGLTAMDVKELKARLLLLLFGKEQKAEGGESQGEFVRWYRKFADTHSPETNTRTCYYHTLSRLRAFCPELEFLPFSAITVGWLEDFDRFLAKTCKLNSRNHHMRNIRAVFK